MEVFDLWIDQLELLTKIANTKPRSLCTASVGGCDGEVTNLMKNIPKIDDNLSASKDLIRFIYIPDVTINHIC